MNKWRATCPEKTSSFREITPSCLARNFQLSSLSSLFSRGRLDKRSKCDIMGKQCGNAGIGRQAGLRCLCSSGREGSSPFSRTIECSYRIKRCRKDTFLFFCFPGKGKDPDVGSCIAAARFAASGCLHFAHVIYLLCRSTAICWVHLKYLQILLLLCLLAT